MRVYELARILNVTSKDLIAEFKKMRVPVASASSSIEDKHVRKVMERFDKKKTDEAVQRERERKQTEERRRVEDEQRRRDQEERHKREEEEGKKREEEERKQHEEEERRRKEDEAKRQEEAKRRKQEEERRKREEDDRKKREQEQTTRRPKDHAPAAAAAAPPGERRRHGPSSQVKAGAPAAREAPGQRPPQQPGRGGQGPRQRPAGERPAGERPAGERGRERERPAGERREERRPRKRGDQRDGVVEVFEVPKIEVMKLEDPRKIYADRARRRAKERKKSGPGKAGRFAEDEAAVEVAVEHPPHKAPSGARRIRPSFVVAQQQQVAPARREAPAAHVAAEPRVIEPKVVQLRGEVTVGQFADKLGVSLNDLVGKLIGLGEPKTINQPLSEDLCQLLGLEFGMEVQIIPETDEYDLRQYAVEDRAEQMVRRPPVVTIMGHVDHGKTTLLDQIRRSHIVDQEFGGITQHIGAYRVATPRGEITFLDTPGHEAFTSMRARGASVTDIVILVVAAEDGVMPQTVEAIDHARAANVPILVAVNKIDKPGANLDRVRQGLMVHNLLPEELGGETIFVNISAKQGVGVDQLLEMILLQAEVLELKADPDRRAEGVVVEARVDPTRGSVCTLLVQKGTLRVSDTLVIGRRYGRVRAMTDEYGKQVEKALPAFPVEVLGLGGSPEAGERFMVMPDERSARNVAAIRDDRRRQRLLGSLGPRNVSLENLHELIEEGKIKEFRLILKGDVQGSIEAVAQMLGRIPSEKIKVRILHSAVGSVTESDVNLAKASEAIIVGFNVRPDPGAAAMADREHVEIRLYQIIYELLEDIRKAMTATLEPERREIALGRVEVRQVFRITKVGLVAGSFVTEGEVRRGARARLVRDGVVVHDGQIASLRRVKDDVERVLSGVECGISLANYQDIKEGDVLEVYRTEEVPVEL
jgi:translation initiation factor IF-2